MRAWLSLGLGWPGPSPPLISWYFYIIYFYPVLHVVRPGFDPNRYTLCSFEPALTLIWLSTIRIKRKKTILAKPLNFEAPKSKISTLIVIFGQFQIHVNPLSPSGEFSPMGVLHGYREEYSMDTFNTGGSCFCVVGIENPARSLWGTPIDENFTSISSLQPS